ncbi:DsrE/DsrF/DsrH-like protein [Hydrogenivirga caldilitoris]|uniref:DsrE/DsrF/DsrH-like protein n=1 Tax=Hydrogenivirga caldilitoris TaxID=246264 RepID=A0A497XRF2_9AQUI|nr:DsrE family protein [Hydrogenivirga caldilitoris]RLJ71607.1 DsrE/DsrF/DsrH-like protein [Hydrogenivirga caldilitoris]
MKLLLILFAVVSFSFAQDKELKAVFDCAVGDLDWVSLRLSLIKKTAESLVREGRDYKFVVTIHSHCIPIVEKDLKRFPPKKARKVEFIQSQLRTLKELYNVEVKACRIAMDRGKISGVPDFIETVPNSWITLIELQNSGFAFVPF